MDRIRVSIIDDHPLFRKGVVHVLTAAGIEIVGEGDSAAETIAMASGCWPDAVILDLNMRHDGMAALQAIREACPMVHVLVLTMAGDEDQLSQAMARGARGYVLKGIGGHELVQAVIMVARGEGYVSPTLAATMVARAGLAKDVRSTPRDPLAELTHRENQIFTLVAQGLRNKEIGGRLDLTEKTVKHYITRIFEKLHVRNRVEAVLLAQAARRAMPATRLGNPERGLAEGYILAAGFGSGR